MAYTIISQNNSTTTLSDGVNTITVPSRVNLTSGNFTIVEVNNNMATLEDGDGNVYRDIPCVATLAGEGGGGGSGLPDQTGHSGEFLTTDGTDASWAAISALQNTATGTDSIATGTATAAGNQSTAFGESAEASTQDSTAYGYDATAKTNIGATAVGASSQAVGQWSSAYGFEAQARNTNCIQLGSGTNTTSGTFKVGFKNSGNYELLDNQGFIPTARFTTDPSADGTYVPTLTISSGVATRSWSAPSGGLPSQTGNSGKFLTTNGTDASWSDKPLINKAVKENSVVINTSPNSTTVQADGQYNTMLGYGARVNNSGAHYNTIVGNGANVSGNKQKNVIFGYGAESYSNNCTTVGCNARANADNAIQIGNINGGTALNSDANTFKVANANGNFEIMDANGNLPADRLASTTGLADGNYRLRLTMASGVPTLTWVAE